MNLLDRVRARPRTTAAVVAVAVAALLSAQVGVVVARSRTPRPAHTGAGPVADPVLPRPSSAARAPSPAAPQPGTTHEAEPARGSTGSERLAAFGGLGAWVDVYDFADLDPARATADMATHGVRTLYLQTGRYNTRTAVASHDAAWLVAGHAAGLRVVGWYLPSYRHLGLDVRRTVAIATYEAGGQRFDGLGIDVEFKNDVRHVPTWNARVAQHARMVRARLGDAYPITAITPPPLQMDVAPWRWAGFPWRALAEASDVIMLMDYWSFRDCKNVPVHCAGPFTARNIAVTHLLTGAPHIPIHVIGGVGDSITGREVARFASAARRAGAYGASLYDYQTTRASFWRLLAPLANL
jgi:hypothetical protein